GGLGRDLAVEVIDPDRGIDHDHASSFREVMPAPGSPSQGSLPRYARMRACCLRRTSVLKPNSTTSRLVLSPVAFRASAINACSRAMFVRMPVSRVYGGRALYT